MQFSRTVQECHLDTIASCNSTSTAVQCSSKPACLQDAWLSVPGNTFSTASSTQINCIVHGYLLQKPRACPPQPVEAAGVGIAALFITNRNL